MRLGYFTMPMRPEERSCTDTMAEDSEAIPRYQRRCAAVRRRGGGQSRSGSAENVRRVHRRDPRDLGARSAV